MYELFASVGVIHECPSDNTLAPRRGTLFSISSRSCGELDSGALDVVVGIRPRLQASSHISDKLGMWLSRDDVVNTLPIRGPGTIECTRRASLGAGEERVNVGKLFVSRKPQKRGSVAVTHPGVPPKCPNHLTAIMSYSYTSSRVRIYPNKHIVAAGHSTTSTIQTRSKHILMFPRIGHSVCQAICNSKKSDSVGLAY